MKPFLVAFIAVLSSFHAAHAVKYPILGSKEKFGVEALICVRSIVEKKIGGKDGLQLAVDILNDVSGAGADVNQLVEIVRACNESLEKGESLAISIEEQHEFAWLLSHEKYSEQVRRLLRDFFYPAIQCKKIGVGVGVGIHLAVAAKLDGAYCLGSNGRQWLQLSPGVGYGGGWVGTLDINWGKYVEADQYRKSPLGIHKSEKISVAALLGKAKEDYADSVFFGDDFMHEEVSGPSIGSLGYFVSMVQADIKIIPLGTREGYLAKRLNDIWLKIWLEKSERKARDLYK